MTQIVFKYNDNIGMNAAEQDDAFLNSCFIDTGILDDIRNTQSQKFILLGRTGTGKTALLKEFIKGTDKSREIFAEELTFHCISNSITFIKSKEVDASITPFFKVLWHNILTLIILRIIVPENEPQPFSFLRRIFTTDKNSSFENYIKELERMTNNNFWVNIKEQVQTLVSQIDKGFRASANTNIPPVGVDFNADLKESVEDHKVRNILNTIVNNSINSEYQKSIDIINSALPNKSQHVLITIDKLDEQWTEELFLYELLRTLIMVVAVFNSRVENVKILIALRNDLYLRMVEDSKLKDGFQEEKFRSFCHYLSWSKDQLKELVDKRINMHFKSRYTKQSITFEDILDIKDENELNNFFSHVLSLTWFRPRDIIEYVNICIEAAYNTESSININLLTKAEAIYSEKRFRSIIDEWGSNYPMIGYYLELFKDKPQEFTIETLSNYKDFFKKRAEKLSDYEKSCGSKQISIEYYCDSISFEEYIRYIIDILLQTETLFIKNDENFINRNALHYNYNYNNTTTFSFHPAIALYLNCTKEELKL